jgi:hypothetical protein
MANSIIAAVTERAISATRSYSPPILQTVNGYPLPFEGIIVRHLYAQKNLSLAIAMDIYWTVNVTA